MWGHLFLRFCLQRELEWRTPPIAMATGYFPARMVLNLLHIISCVTQATLFIQLPHVNAQVTSDICGKPRGGLLIFPPKVAGLVLLAGTPGLTMTGDCSKAGIRLDLDHSVRLWHMESLMKECIDFWLKTNKQTNKIANLSIDNTETKNPMLLFKALDMY